MYGDCGYLRMCMRVCECVCLYGDCVEFVCISGHGLIVIVCVCVCGSMFVNVMCACMMVVLRLYVFLAMCVW